MSHLPARLTALAATAGAFVAAGVAAKVVDTRRREHRREQRGEDVAFGSVHSTPRTVIVSDGVALNVEVDEQDDDGSSGSAPLTVVFVHGWVCTLDTWHYQRLALRGLVRMVFYDQRSHGASGRSSRHGSSFEQLADDLRTILDEVAPDGPVVLVGHSMGGITVQQLAAESPSLFGDRVVGAVLLSTSAGRLVRQSPGLRRLLPLLRAGSPLLDWGRTFNSYSVVRRWAVGPDAPQKYADMSDEMILRAHTSVLLDFYPAFVDLDVRTGAKGLAQVPVVVACGTKDLLTPISHARRLADAIDGAELVTLEDAGHMIPFEENVAVTRAIEDVLEAVGHPVREQDR
ncbi:alpha/beta fold hydrolase [Aeromicrobium sp. 50.2.37]|uniref:alpha/beta fold hydrolase n=1 Tax=Aeromicrobium sp. 50.2.37 TaxID=2969305 RepID=UPI00214FD5BF|nr:alpha/beta hydrolase [Aeromicrobium sp. 50.2.37]MCR4514957.1 alpha/beta hydrolase [Aeromicrobium sp. 50.2.37]